MHDLRAWARQPTTVAGISALIATISAVVLKQLEWGQAIPLIAGAVVSMVLPDNSAAAKQAQDLADEIVVSLNNKPGESK